MIANCFLQLAEIEQRVCDVASKELAISRHKLSPSSRITEDVGCDSLDAVELLIAVEEAFGVTPETMLRYYTATEKKKTSDEVLGQLAAKLLPKAKAEEEA